MDEGDKSLTLKDIARMAGTSVSTVSRVLSNHPRISENTRRRVMALVEEHGFELNPAARALAGGRTGLIGVLASNIGSGFFAEVIHGIDRMTRWQKGHIMCSFATDYRDYHTMLRRMSSRGQVDGVVLVAPPAQLFAQPMGFDFPLVCCASAPPEASRWYHCDSITFDNREAMIRIVDRLVNERGCRNLVHAGGPDDNFDALERRAAFVEAASRHAHIRAETASCGYEADDVNRALDPWLDAGTLPDGFVAWNDATAVCILERLKSLPGETRKNVAVTGWDDDPMDGLIGLTSVRMPMREMGEHAARLLYERLDDPPRTEPVHEMFELTCVFRETG